MSCAGEPQNAELYLDLMKRCLTRCAFPETHRSLRPHRGSLARPLYAPIKKVLALAQLDLMMRVPFDLRQREEGRDLPSEAETMVGLRRLDQLQHCASEILRGGVPGDFMETGAWRGGAAIFMRALLKAFGETHRRVWVADSFRGLPAPDAVNFPADAGSRLGQDEHLVVSLEQVKANFARYGLLDEQVRFLDGWFGATLPGAPIERLAVLRLDGDLYQSTIEALRWLYPKLSVGGYLIVDDYGAIPACKTAVDDYRADHRITEPIEVIDWTGVFWRRSQ